MFSFKFSGDREMKRRLQNVQKKYRRKVKKALRERAEKIMKRSRDHFVPVDTGDLHDTGRVEDGKDLEVLLTYGDADVDYAEVVHETHPTQSKYLEIPFMEAASSVIKDIARAAPLSEDDTK